MTRKSSNVLDEVVIKVDNVGKTFKLPHERQSSIKSKIIAGFKGHKNYDTQTALKNISFEVKKGEFFGIVGRNGSGKSTLLKMLAKIYQPTQGKIHTTGKLVPFIELGVGFNPELSGRDNVYLNGAMLGFSEEEIQKKYKSIVDFAELEKFMDQKLKNYSSGMQVRLAFSVATILAESDILLLDEVLAVGDAEFQRKCYDYFKTLKKNKKTVIFVSHDMNAIKDYCDRAFLIENGTVVSQGSANSVANAYTKLFIPDEQKLTSSTNSNRWGTKAIEFQEVRLSPSKIQEQSEIMLMCKMRVNVDTDHPIAGFSIKSASDQRILGTNTKLVDANLGLLKKGQSLTVEWLIPNIFNDGSHFVNVAVESENLEAYDWWEDALKFEVYKNSGTGFVADVPIGFKIKS